MFPQWKPDKTKKTSCGTEYTGNIIRSLLFFTFSVVKSSVKEAKSACGDPAFTSIMEIKGKKTENVYWIQKSI